jgi:glycosyltransferase involved in cell wall biosynthesis
MNIVQISTHDFEGGAARAAYRLHRGLQQIGETSLMVSRYKVSGDDSVLALPESNSHPASKEAFFLETVIQGHYIDTHRTDLSNTLFSLPYPGYDLSHLPQVRGADIINLHWVARYQSLPTLQKLFALGKPVVWTLHDQWAFTGGCHYTAGCERYREDCAVCPQLADDPFDLTAAVLKDRLGYFKNGNLTIVTPSRWMAGCARESRLFKDLRVEVIPNSLETDFFRPLPKSEAKMKLGLKPEMITVLFGATDVKEKRKGFQTLLSAIRCCSGDPRVQELTAAGRFKILCFGSPGDDLQAVGIPVVPLGFLDTEEKIRLVYAASDLFILPSLQDNLPNTVLEAMSCGTPVIGSKVGGIPDMIQDGVSGYLVEPNDSQELAETIVSVIFETGRLERMGRSCRQQVEAEYKLSTQAKRYLALYQELRTAPRTLTPVQEEIQSRGREESAQVVKLETEVGPHLSDIYDSVLLKALKEFAPCLYQEWEKSEADRAARFAQIAALTENLRELKTVRGLLGGIRKRLGKRLVMVRSKKITSS